jgi:hypothetical protein
MDARAWRLDWPAPPAPPGGGAAPRALLIEVDQPAVLALKARAFQGLELHPSLGERRTLACDLAETEGDKGPPDDRGVWTAAAPCPPLRRRAWPVRLRAQPFP